MSRTWELDIEATPEQGSPRVGLAEVHEHLRLQVDQPGTFVVCVSLTDEAGRAIRDWLSWYLGEGPEPGADREPRPCLCDDKWDDCLIHVGCDDDCRALRDPSTLQEWKAAAVHWHYHSLTCGCSHGN